MESKEDKKKMPKVAKVVYSAAMPFYPIVIRFRDLV